MLLSENVNDMIHRFTSFIETHRLCSDEDKILVAVSGGIDSMVMLDLFLKTGYRIGIAHCNFNLRGKESDGDQKFVSDFAGKRNIPLHITGFETQKYAAERGISIQMAARDLRYHWLGRIKKEHNYHCIAVGHNNDDSIETFFINLTRNSGIHGLTGIKPKFRDIIRPLLFASRQEIAAFAKSNHIDFREDSSNIETKYLRNKIRHQIIPEFEKVNPSFKSNIQEVVLRLRDLEKQLADLTCHYQNTAVTIADEQIRIDFTRFPSDEIMQIVLFEMVKDYGFNGDQVKSMIEAIHSQPGKQFFSDSFKLVKDRNEFIITRKREETENQYIIEKQVSHINIPVELSFEVFPGNDSVKISPEPDIAFLDYDKIAFPLKLRKWQKGDRFMPFGMKHFKKLSDFFTDNRLSLAEKEAVWLVVSGGDIIWIINYRIDNRYRITDETKNIYKITYKKAKY
ncbi:MAG: tRNA lysidine(34) synthetase TilS [Bacteroidales bacterium]|nr:tRNA lysidine(34) synthetase TilS [Bacteroidales bacterium]